MHKPVLYSEVITYINPKGSGVYIDCTLGNGGHAEGILCKTVPGGTLIGIEVDPERLDFAAARLEKFNERCIFVNDNYKNLSLIMRKLNVREVDGVLLDLGVATEHFTDAKRGFSILREGPLDMRLDQRQRLTAAHIVNKWKPEKLEKLFWAYGEERKARFIVNNIVKARKQRPIETTKDLADIVAAAVSRQRPGKSKVPGYRIHPATRTFQALRIVVNNELENIKLVLQQTVDILKPDGVLCIISFHSLEDRIVKNFFRDSDELKIITKKPIVASREEMMDNPRSRSAKLRVAQKV